MAKKKQEEKKQEEEVKEPKSDEEPVAEEPKPKPKPEVKGRPVTKREAKAAKREVDAEFLEEFNTMRARLAAIEAKQEITVEEPTTLSLTPLQPDEFPPSWGEKRGWQVIVPRKTGDDIIINGFKVPLVAGEVCKVPKNVIRLAIAGGYI